MYTRCALRARSCDDEHSTDLAANRGKFLAGDTVPKAPESVNDLSLFGEGPRDPEGEIQVHP
jgi:hypothetical protein